MPISVGQKGKCPHCNTQNRFETTKYMYGTNKQSFSDHKLVRGSGYTVLFRPCRCTHCGENIFFLGDKMIYPHGHQRDPAPSEVPDNISEDFNEACMVEPISKKASAALARRCLQNMLREQGIKKRDLNAEIDEARKGLPVYLSDAIDAVRNIGNFAAHPMKYQNTGEIVEVEEGETEWILNVIEQLFDFYYVKPAETKARKDELNKKLKEMGKPPMK